MSMIERSLDGMALISGHLGAMLRRRLRELAGIALLSLAMVAAIALATWSVRDPSLSHATDAPIHNLLGRQGAIAADLMMQLLGLGSLALLLPIGVWGYRLLGHRPLGRERLRVLLWLLGAVLAAAACGALVVLAVKSQIHVAPLPTILATGAAFAATYGGLVWRFDLLNESERLAIAGWVRKARIATGLALDYERE